MLGIGFRQSILSDGSTTNPGGLFFDPSERDSRLLDSGEGIMKIFQYEGPQLDPLAIAQMLNTDINARV